MGFFRFEGLVHSACFVKHDGQTKVLAMLANGLLAGVNVPVQPAANRIEPYPEADAPILYRKVDRGSKMVMANYHTGDIYLTGTDKLLKKYEFP